MKKPPFQVTPSQGRFQLRLKKATTNHYQHKPHQITGELFTLFDDSDQDCQWTYNPSRPLSREEIKESFREIYKRLDQPEGRTS